MNHIPGDRNRDRRRRKPPPGGPRFRRYFTHYRTKKLMDAHAYGHKFWPIGGRR